MTTKRCFKCLNVLPLDDFYSHAAMADGHLNKCKSCTRNDVTEHRLSNLDKIRKYDLARATQPHRVASRKRVVAAYYGAHPDRRKAASAVARALRKGVLEKQPCFICGGKALAHHPDYSRPLDVVWLCQAHHKQAHAIARSAPGAQDHPAAAP